MSETDLVVRPAMDLKVAKGLFDEFEKIKSDVLQESDVSTISGKTFVNKTGWRKIKTMFGCSEEILSRDRMIDADGTIRYIYRVRVKIHDNKFFADAEGMCDTNELFAYQSKNDYLARDKTKLKPENMLMAMAQCVPLSSEILTKEGFKKYNEILIG